MSSSKQDYFVHESSYVDGDVEIGAGTKIWHFSHVMPGSQIGRACRIGQNVVVGPRAVLGNNVKVQNNVSIYEGVVLEDDVFCGPSMVFTNVMTPRSAFPRNTADDFLPTVVRQGASIGANATIVCGVTIGRHALVGAGAVVTRDVPDYAIVHGNPARLKGWACQCGTPIQFLEDAAHCQACRRDYRRSETGEVVIVPETLPQESAVRLPRTTTCFSMEQYDRLLAEFREAGYQFQTFTRPEIPDRPDRPALLLRHDIDMELERALEMARVEAAASATATYFFLIRTTHYNLFSREGTDAVRSILDLGHRVGLHFDCAAYDCSENAAQLASCVAREAELLSGWFDTTVDIVSFHRPSALVLQGSPRLTAPLKHTYMPEFVEQMHYCSDSRGAFRHGHPLESDGFRRRRPIQLLTHPIWWGPRPIEPAEALDEFVERRRASLERSVAANCQAFRRSAESPAA